MNLVLFLHALKMFKLTDEPIIDRNIRIQMEQDPQESHPLTYYCLSLCFGQDQSTIIVTFKLWKNAM